MLRRMIRKRLASEERRLGGSLDYLRHIVRESLPAFVKFAAFTPLANHRSKLPAAPYHVARIVATRAEDCGTCLQMEVNLARTSGVPKDVIQAVVDGLPERLAGPLAEVYGFTEAVVSHSGEEGDLRESIRSRYGEEALVELALAIASCRVFPTTKRALGYAISCERVSVQT